MCETMFVNVGYIGACHGSNLLEHDTVDSIFEKVP